MDRRSPLYRRSFFYSSPPYVVDDIDGFRSLVSNFFSSLSVASACLAATNKDDTTVEGTIFYGSEKDILRQKIQVFKELIVIKWAKR